MSTVLHLISRRPSPDAESGTGSSSTTSDYSRASLTPPPEFSESFGHYRTIIYVDVVLEPVAWSTPYPVVHFIDNMATMPLSIHLVPLEDPLYYGDALPGQSTPSLLRTLDPTITFASPCALVLYSTFCVFLEGMSDPIHTEVVPLKFHSSPVESSGWQYSTTLIPGFWKSFRESTCRFQLLSMMIDTHALH